MMAPATVRARLPLLLLLGILFFLAAASETFGALEEIKNPSRGVRERKQGQEGSQSQSQASRNNPFHFPSRRFQTRYRNEHGRIRVLQRFDRRSSQLQNLQNYRVVEYESAPNTLLKPHHSDADFILVVQQGQATVTVADPNKGESYNLERGDALRIPAGVTSYILNRDDNQNLRLVEIAIPVNKPGQFEYFFPASSQEQQSFFRGFSRNTLEASFNARFEEIRRILLEENEGQQEEEQGQRQPRRHESRGEGVIVKVSKEKIQELTRHARSNSRRGSSSESGPFNLRSRNPIYSNKFGRLFEVNPDRNPKLQDLDIFLSCVEMKEGSLMLPHYNSKAIVVLVVDQGRGNLELVAVREQQQREQEEEEEEGREQEQREEEDDEEERNRQVRRYSARLSQGDVVVIPAAHPVAINASSDLHFVGFGINAKNNQRIFLAGENDNVINQIHRQVKELAFPGSGQEVERLIRNQRESHFASARPQAQQGEEEGQGRRDPLSSILEA